MRASPPVWPPASTPLAVRRFQIFPLLAPDIPFLLSPPVPESPKSVQEIVDQRHSPRRTNNFCMTGTAGHMFVLSGAARASDSSQSTGHTRCIIAQTAKLDTHLGFDLHPDRWFVGNNTFHTPPRTLSHLLTAIYRPHANILSILATFLSKSCPVCCGQTFVPDGEALTGVEEVLANFRDRHGYRVSR